MTTIGHSITIKGEVSSDEALRVDGNVRGQILMRDAELTIGPSARVDADLRATRVLVLGTVRGNIAASTRVELGVSSNVTGDITADDRRPCCAVPRRPGGARAMMNDPMLNDEC